ncbi:ashwin [Patella vulgata]|uniref:ashwin n=1 Tax=Patella vulgata TaxID=6465 RepID=UPI00218087DA|nr:ashwin [Patella vulgata]
MAAPTDHNSSDYDLLYPELLSRDVLIKVLHQRYIQKTNIQSLDKEELLNLYYQYILPLPQRKYKLNRRGREMTKKQILKAKKRRFVNTSTTDGDPPKKKRLSTESLLITPSGSPSANRLKPPPSCINYDKKVIKLNSIKNLDEAEKIEKLTSDIDKLSPSSNKTKEISSKKAFDTISFDTDKVKSSKQVIQSSEVAMEIETNKEESNEPKKKIKKISWP